MKLENDRLRLYERVVAAVLLAGAIIAVVGIAAAGFQNAEYGPIGARVGAAGLLVVIAAIALSYPLTTFKTLRRAGTGGVEYDQMKFYSQLKASSILLNLLWILGILALVLALAGRTGTYTLPTGATSGAPLAAVAAIIIVLNLSHVHYLSLRVTLVRNTQLPVTAFHYISLAAAIPWPVAALALLGRPYQVTSSLTFGPADVLGFLLAGAVFASIALFVARPVPNLVSIFRDDPGRAGQRDYISRTKSVLLPAATAFALLLVIVFIMLIVGVGPRGIQSPVQGLVFLFIMVMITGSVIFSVRLARSEDIAELYKVKVSAETRTDHLILYASMGVAAVFGAVAMWLLRGHSVWVIGPSRWVDVLSIGLLIAFGPYGFYLNRKLARIRRLEERFPDFLRDVAASHRGGLTLTSAIQIAAQGEYGDLTPDIRKMADQLSWNIPFNEALTQLMDRVKTPLVQRAITLIVEASRSGGNTTDVLLAAARDSREIKNLENERRTTMALYTIIIYITFFVFLGVAAVLYGKFVPELLKSSAAARGQNSAVAGLRFNTPSKSEFRAFYFLASLVQGAGNGFVGGLFQYGRALTGLKHAFTMVLITYIAFTFIFP